MRRRRGCVRDAPRLAPRPAGFRRFRCDDGSASLELITAGVILLVPLVYLILAMAAIQGAALAVEGVARASARVFVQSPTEAEGRAAIARIVEFAAADQDISLPEVRLICDPNPTRCLSPRGTVTVMVTYQVALPLVPQLLDLNRTASVPLQAEATQTVSRFWGKTP